MIAAVVASAPAAAIEASPGSTSVAKGSNFPPLRLGPPVATLTAETPVSAGDGWLVWSAPAPLGWKLVTFHEGKTSTVPIAPRAEPFDATVGTDVRGRAVATFSRCASPPTMATVGYVPDEEEIEAEGGLLAEPTSGAGCRIDAVDLSSGHESSVPIPHPRGTSDTTPAMWNGSVAFSRIDKRRHGLVSQVMLWSPSRAGHVRTLPHGVVPTMCPTRIACRHGYGYGEVSALAYDGRLIAFVWKQEATWRRDGAGTEGRVDVVASGKAYAARTARDRASLLGRTSDVCMGETPFEFVWDGTALAEGGSAFFSQVFEGNCFRTEGGSFREARPQGDASAMFSPPALAWAKDAGHTYALVSPADKRTIGCSNIDPCVLQEVGLPTFVPKTRPGRDPLFSSVTLPASSG